ncbi:MAG: hypothetical protein RL344_93 [Pseudomonadota bacterium]|jgi:hypothetical protein
MSYDYSSESNSLDLVNPYVFQNRILFASGTALLLTSLYIFFKAQQALQLSLIGKSILFCLLGIGLSCVAVSLFAKAMQRLKFYFGRDKPSSLATDVPLGTTGSSEQAIHLQSLLRQRALAYAEPQGALQSVLYHRFPKLLTAPIWVQNFANQYFLNLCTVLATFLSFLIAWFFAKEGVTETWVSLIYFLASVFWLIKPYSTVQRQSLTMSHLIMLMVAAIMLPILLGLLATMLPSLLGLTFHTQIFVLLGCATISSLLLLCAALGQTTDTPITQVSNELLRVSMSSPPATLFQEIERIQQMQWTDNIPNRCYSRLEPSTPVTSLGGSFAGDLLQETQPMPIQGRNTSDTHSIFADSSRKFLGFSDVFAVFLIGVSILFILIFVNGFNTQHSSQYISPDKMLTPSISSNLKNKVNIATNISENSMPKSTAQSKLLINWSMQNWSLLTGAFMMISAALFCLKNAAYLWGRFDFKSNLLWVTVQGNYQTATLGTGNNFSGQMHTENKFVRVEDMTVNIWRTCIESVCFGANSPRQVTSMFATQKEAKDLVNDLLTYINGQSILTVPQSDRDRYKMSTLFQAEQILKTGKSVANSIDAVNFHTDTLLQNDTTTPSKTIHNILNTLNALEPTDIEHPNNSDALINLDTPVEISDIQIDEVVSPFKFCSVCGARHLLSAKFCSKCGAVV